jgi:cytochrome oxidase Cu insertion factor (SCO1/SenC/PrrC family)
VKVGSVFLFLGLLGLSVPTEQKMPPGNSAVAPPIGLEIGQHAPAFTKTDQFGKEQSNETLKGSKGTILLFFRSADW